MFSRIARLTLLLLLVCNIAWAEDFLGAPLPPGEGKVISTSDKLVERAYPQSMDDILAFYKKAMEGEKDVRIRPWADGHVVEDFGSRPWNKVLIAPQPGGGTKVTIGKDSWTWIIGMLTLRFTGVFVVLVCLFIAMGIATSIIRRTVKESPQETA